MSFLIRTKFSGYAPDGRRTLEFGGGGSSGTYYGNQDKLLGAQADIATGVYNDIYQPNAPGAISALAGMTHEAQDGTLTQQARDTAGADAGDALSSSLAATQRGRDRTGAAISPDQAGHDDQQAAIQGAAIRTGAMTQAQQWGEGQKWGRTADLYNSLQGVPTQSAGMLGNAAGAYGQIGNRNQTNMNTAAGGLARLGVSVGSGLKDGGEVRGLKRYKCGGAVKKMAKGGELCMASGGYLPKIDSGTMQASHGPQGLSRVDAAASFALPIAARVAANELVKPFIKDTVAPSLRQAWASAKGTMGQGAPVTDATMTPVSAGDMSVAEAQASDPLATQAAAPVADSAVTPVEQPVAQVMPVDMSSVADTPASASMWDVVDGYKNGGTVRGLRRQQHFAIGGMVQYAPSAAHYAPAAPSSPAPHVSITSGQFSEAPDQSGAQVDNAIVSEGVKQVGKAVLTPSQAPAPVIDAVPTAVTPVAETATTEGATALAGEATGDAAAAAAAEAASAAAAEEAAMALVLLKNGGAVRGKPGLRRQALPVRKDIRKGGPIHGPGTSTSDSVPLMGSAGEFMLNAEATKMVGKAKLNAINQRGLVARRQGA